MSRASNVRDAIAEQVKLAGFTISGQAVPVDSVILPIYTKEQVVSPRIYCMVGPRLLESDQGPDVRQVAIGVGVVGATPDLEGYSLTAEARDPQFLSGGDELDGLFESILGLWTPNGPLWQMGLAEHAFDSIEQPAGIDGDMYRNRGMWNLVAFVTYTDSKDD